MPWSCSTDGQIPPVVCPIPQRLRYPRVPRGPFSIQDVLATYKVLIPLPQKPRKAAAAQLHTPQEPS